MAPSTPRPPTGQNLTPENSSLAALVADQTKRLQGFGLGDDGDDGGNDDNDIDDLFDVYHNEHICNVCRFSFPSIPELERHFHDRCFLRFRFSKTARLRESKFITGEQLALLKSDEQPFRFMDLPKELRLQVYEWVFTLDSPKRSFRCSSKGLEAYVGSPFRHSNGSVWSHTDKINTSILKVSKKIHEDAVGYLYKAVTFKLGNKCEVLRKFLSKIGPRNQSNITRFRILCYGHSEESANGLTSGMLDLLFAPGFGPPRVVITLNVSVSIPLRYNYRATGGLTGPGHETRPSRIQRAILQNEASLRVLRSIALHFATHTANHGDDTNFLELLEFGSDPIEPIVKPSWSPESLENGQDRQILEASIARDVDKALIELVELVEKTYSKRTPPKK